MHNLINFIDNNKNWKDLLKAEPYHLQIGESEDFPNLYLFKYNQIKSDFNLAIVRESRGIIIEVDSKYGNSRSVCTPFDKFWNWGDSRADDLDEDSMVVQEKVDGSICKLFFYQGKWRIATNGTINAYETPMPHSSELFFGDLIKLALDRKNLDYSILNRNYTYIFEFASKWNKIVVDYGEDAIWHIGTRDNRDGKELLIDIGIKKPKVYSLNSLMDVVSASESLPANEEGYVVVDKDFNRLKIKSPLYVAAHRLKGNSGIVDLKRILEVVSINESAEFLNYFPEYKKEFAYVQHLWDTMKLYITGLEKYVGFKKMGITRKEIALMIQREVHQPFQQFAYKFLDGADFSFEKITIQQLKEYFEV